MKNPYNVLFAVPGSKGLMWAGLLARIPLPMTGIGIIVMLAQLRSSYALAGAVSATFVLAYALLSPQISRLVDRHGQARVLPVASAASVAGMLLLLAGARQQAPDWTLFASAVLAGSMPSMSAMVRARWSTILGDQSRLQAAYSLETVLDELTFIIGPPLSVGLSVALLPQAGLIAAAVLLPLGVMALVMQSRTAPDIVVDSDTTGDSRSLIRLAGVRLLVLLMVAMGVIVGTVDIVSVALAEHFGQAAAASLVLSAYALGSCVSGLVFGAIKFTLPLHCLLLLCGVATALTSLPLLHVGSIATMTVVILIVGVFFAPMMIVAMTLVAHLVPAQRLTEGMTWLLAALNVGVASGAAVSGQVVAHSGADAGFLVAVCAAVLVLLLAVWGQRRMRVVDTQATHMHDPHHPVQGGQS